MAEILLHNFNIISNTNNDFSPAWVSGDIIQTYYDTATELFVVKRNYSTITSGPDLGVKFTDYVPKNFGYNFCVGTTLNFFELIADNNPVFPYLKRSETLNATSCQTLPEACNINVNVTSITSETIALNDGSFIATGDSTIGSTEVFLADFNYGSGETSPFTFTGLTAGQYTVYARDANNCLATQTVEVKILTNEDVKYRAEFNDLQGQTHRFDILERNYSGSITELTSGSAPLILNMHESSEFGLFDPIKPSSADLNLISETDFKYASLFTNDERKFRGIYYINDGGGLAEMWQGFLVPSLFSERYITPPYESSFTFIDGLEDLENIPFLDFNDNKLAGNLSLLNIIIFCLKSTGLNLPIRSGINLYSTAMASTATDDPLTQTFVNQSSFYIDEENTPSCKYVLENILKPFGARIRQWGGYWNITRIEEEYTSYDYREYTFQGIYSTNGTFSPNINMDEATVANRIVMQDQNGLYKMAQPSGEVSVTYAPNPKKSIIENYDFEKKDKLAPLTALNWGFAPSGAGVAEFYEISNPDRFGAFKTRGVNVYGGRDAYIYSEKVQNVHINSGTSVFFSITVSYRNILTTIPFVPIQWQIIVKSAGGISYYLKENGDWTTTESRGRFYYAGSSEQTFSIESNTSVGGTINTGEGATAQVRLYAADWENVELGTTGTPATLANIQAIDTDNKPAGYGLDVYYDSASSGADYDAYWYYQLEDNLTDAESNPTVIHPDDRATSFKVWRRVGDFIRRSSSFQQQSVSYDDVILMVIDNGVPISNKIKYKSTNNSKLNISKLNIDTIFGDLPLGTSAKAIYQNYFKLLDGTSTFLPTNYVLPTSWQRSGKTETRRLEEILLQSLANQFLSIKRMIEFTGTTLEAGSTGKSVVRFLDTITDTYDSSRVYILNSMSIDCKNNSYKINMIELNAQTDETGASPFGADFNTDFGQSFNVFYENDIIN